MLVIMTGGVDLSVPGTMSLAAVIIVGVGDGSKNENIWIAIATALAVGALIGLVNGLLIGGLKLNPLITTLAVGLIVAGVVNRYASTFPVQSRVPPGLSDWTSGRVFGWRAPVFWTGAGLTVVLIVGLRYTAVGRRFQAVGANPVASHIVGVRVNLNQILVYVVAAVFYAIAGVALAGLLRNPGVGAGTTYLLGPIAVVVIGGASLTGGLASTFSTWVAAFFLTLLNQMLRVLGLSSALQFVAFGVAIVGGMIVSGRPDHHSRRAALSGATSGGRSRGGRWTKSRTALHAAALKDRSARKLLTKRFMRRKRS